MPTMKTLQMEVRTKLQFELFIACLCDHYVR